jgi:cell division protein FtsZ
VQPAAPAPAAVANDVHIQPAQPRIPHYAEAPAPARRVVEHQEPGPFIPPAAEQPMRAPRMPQVEDLPLPAQNQIRAQRGEAPESETKRRSLLERLASFGLNRQEETPGPRPVQLARSAPPAAPAPARQPGPSPVHAEYAKRPPAAPRPQTPHQAQLDLHGRAAPQQKTAEDDHLEIPAFLRRQAN